MVVHRSFERRCAARDDALEIRHSDLELSTDSVDVEGTEIPALDRRHRLSQSNAEMAAFATLPVHG